MTHLSLNQRKHLYLPQGFEMPEGIVAKTGFLLNHALDGRGGDHIGLWLQKTQANGAAELLKIYTLMCGDGVLRAYATFDGAPTTAIYQPPRKEGYLSLDLSQTGMVPVGLQDFVEKVYAMRGTNSVRNSSLDDESFRPSFRPRAVLLGERSRPKGDSPY